MANKSTKTEKEIQLENEVAELKKMVLDLVNQKQTNIVKESDEEDIPFRKFIKVMSLCYGKLALSTEGRGQGSVYHFTEFGEIQPIIYEDLSKIIHNQKRFAENGKFYIMDKNVQKLHGLTNSYTKFLNKETIETIFDMDKDKMIDLFKSTTKVIQHTIVSMIHKRIKNGEELDLNRLKIIGDIYGENLLQAVENQKQNND